jgi:muramoyltetrapeptide carboxypeptidase
MKALQKGDLIAIVAPAKSIEKEHVSFAKNYLEKAGFSVIVGENCLNTFHYFAGTDVERASDFQDALDNPNVKAILCARGGYGCIRILDHLQWASFIQNPKWIIGFSDVTVFHQRVQSYNLQSIHATMPLNFSENSKEALDSLIRTLYGEKLSYSIPSNPNNKPGKATGKLVGGNLSILYSLLGTKESIDYQDTILFIEDLAEQLYHIDRIFYSLSKAGILEKIKGLIVGGMTDLKDTAVPFGQTYFEIILSHFIYRKIPIVFEFPAGHITDNRALILGEDVELLVSDAVQLNFIPTNTDI